MRKLIAWPMFLLTYHVGDLASDVCNVWPDCQDGGLGHRIFRVFFDTYQQCMRWSLFWSNWGGLKQWSDAS